MSASTTPRIRRGISFVIVALLAFLVGRMFGSSDGPPPKDGVHTAAEHAAEATAPEVWTCSMHPQIRMPEPGKCPICGMNLILADSGGGGDDEGIFELRMSEGAMKRAKIQTARVERIELAHEVPLVGRVMLDETRVTTYTARVEGRLDRLFVDFTGTQIKAGEHIAEIYSPILYSAQEELLRAMSAADKVAGNGLELLRESSLATVKSAHERLHLFGIDEEQIDELIARGEPSVYMTLRSPATGTVVHKAVDEGAFVKEGQDIVKIADLSKVWVVLDAYESDLAWLRYGQVVRFSVEAYPGEPFEARVAFIDPILDAKTRTVKVRLNVENGDRRLKPDMFVRARVEAMLSSAGQVMDETLAGIWMCPMHPEVIGDGPGACSECGMPLVPSEELGFVTGGKASLPLAVPDTAPMFTGARSVVYVQLPDHEMPSFEGREVVLGPHAGDYYIVLEGLMEGEDVVVQGNFKIDSELQIRAKRSMMAPNVGRSSDQPASQPVAGPPLTVPAEFQNQLGRLLTVYLALVDGLAEDQLEVGAQSELSEAFGAVDMGLLEGSAHRAWMQTVGALRESVDAASSGADIDAVRVAIGPLSSNLMSAVKSFGAETAGAKLAVFHCPMAYDMAGADWIAPDGPTRNPYFGLDMQKCGDITGPLEQPAAAAGASMDMDMDGMEDMDMDQAQGSAPSGFQEQLGGLVNAYLSFEKGLTEDADSQAVREGLRMAFEAIDMAGLEGDQHMAWMKGSPALKESVEAVIAAEGIEGARVALAPLSSQLLLAIEEFGLPLDGGDRGPLAVFHCPMAFDFEGADWLGEAGPTKNPFFGTEMQTCGSVVRELAQGEGR